MNEHMMPIPSRIYNAAVGGHVAGADQIIDDKTGLTLDKVAGGALEEKEYTSGSNNGMGRVVLRKNLVEGVNTLTQNMINKSNTIYVIQYDFNLCNKTITIPDDCLLEFDGGNLSNGKILGRIKNTYIDIRWFGAKENQDISNPLIMAIQLACNRRGEYNRDTKNIPIYIPSGTYYCNSLILDDYCGNQGCVIYGDRSMLHSGISRPGTIIQPANENQTYIWKTSEVNRPTAVCIDIKDITFSDINSKAHLTDGALWIENTSFSFFDNICFMEMIGTGLKINDSWELTFKTITVRCIGGLEPCILFANRKYSYSNISQIYIDYISFEKIDGNLIESEVGSFFSQTVINCIGGEWYPYTSRIELSNEDFKNAIKWALLKLNSGDGITINSINNISGYIEYLPSTNINGVNYTTSVIFCSDSPTNNTNILIGNLHISATNNEIQNYCIVENSASVDLTISNIVIGGYHPSITIDNPFIFKPKGLGSLNIGTINVIGLYKKQNRTLEWNTYTNPCLYAVRGNTLGQGAIYYNPNIPENFGLGICNGNVDSGVAVKIDKKDYKKLMIKAYTTIKSEVVIYYGGVGVNTYAKNNIATFYWDLNNSSISSNELNVPYKSDQLLVYRIEFIEPDIPEATETLAGVMHPRDKVTLKRLSASGTTSQRPNYTIPDESIIIGCPYFDTTIQKPIWWTGSKWVDATGATV